MRLSADPQFTPEEEVLLWAIRVDHTKDRRVAEILTAGVDWGYLQETAIQHGIVPLLYRRLKGGMADLVPSDELSTLKTLFQETAIRNLQMTQNLLKTLDLLDSSGIEVIPFKGPMLAVQAYGDLSLRSYRDLDILVHVNDLSRAYQILTDQGYTLTGPGMRSIERKLGFLDKKDIRFSFCEEILEVHWKIIERLYSVPLEMDQIWDRSLAVFINDRKVKTMSPDDMVNVLCFHGFKHGWKSLNWLADLIYTISNNPQIKWQEVFVRAETMGLKRITLIGLFLVHKYGGIRCGSEIENMFASDTTVLKLAREIEIENVYFPIN